MITKRPRMSRVNLREPKHKLRRWLTLHRRMRRKHQRKPRLANHNQSKICQELKKRTRDLKRERSSRRCSNRREPSGTKRGSGRLLMRRETLSSFKRPSKLTVMSLREFQRVIDTRESRLRSTSSSESSLTLLVASEHPSATLLLT